MFFFRGEKFYGKEIIEGIQSPGETVYVPNGAPHTVYNLDEIVSVSDNPYFDTAIEESAYLIYHQKNIPFGQNSYINTRKYENFPTGTTRMLGQES